MCHGKRDESSFSRFLGIRRQMSRRLCNDSVDSVWSRNKALFIRAFVIGGSIPSLYIDLRDDLSDCAHHGVREQAY